MGAYAYIEVLHKEIKVVEGLHRMAVRVLTHMGNYVRPVPSRVHDNICTTTV